MCIVILTPMISQDFSITMKLLLVISLVSMVSAAPQTTTIGTTRKTDDVQILRQTSDNIGLGSYQFGFELSDGTKRDETGELINKGAENESIAVKGEYSWTGPDGVVYTVTYIADENGFQPTIEQGPEGVVPRAVIASLQG